MERPGRVVPQELPAARMRRAGHLGGDRAKRAAGESQDARISPSERRSGGTIQPDWRGDGVGT